MVGEVRKVLGGVSMGHVVDSSVRSNTVPLGSPWVATVPISDAISVGPVGDRVLPPCGVVRGVSLPVMSIPGGGSLFNRVLRFFESVCMKSFIVGGQRGARTGAVATEVLPTVVAMLFFFTFFVFSASCRVYLSYRFCLFRS